MTKLKVPYFKKYKSKKGDRYYFSPPSYIVKRVFNKSDKTVILKCKKLSDKYDDAIFECLTIYSEQIKPYLKRSISKEQNKNSFSYIWDKFCERRGIGCIGNQNNLLDKELSITTKKDYILQYKCISKVKNENGKRLIDINSDLITPQTAEKIYLKLFSICKEAYAKKGIDMLRLLFNFGKYKMGILKNQNPFENLRIRKSKKKQPIWKNEDVEEFNRKSVEIGLNEIGLAVRLNMFLGQRPQDFFNLKMENLKKKDGNYYFELVANKTGFTSFAPLPLYLYEEIKEREGRVIKYDSIRTMMKHFVKVKNISTINKDLTFRLTRNSAATAYYEAGANANETMTILGHKQINTNMSIYRQNTPEQALNALEKLLKK